MRGLSIQVRFVRFGNTRLTVVSAIAVQHYSINVQVEARDGILNLYVGGIQRPLPTNHYVYLVTDSNLYSLTGLEIANHNFSNITYSNNKLFIRTNGSDTIFIVLPSGASLKISLQRSFLQVTVELSNQFQSYRYYYNNNYIYHHYISGLIGTFNGNASDDFLLPDGSQVVNTTLISEEDIYNFALACEYVAA